MLTLIYSNISGIKDSIKLKKPPRTDKARWMAFLINILLVWLLQDYLTLTAEELAGAFEISRYAVYIYSEAWFHSPFLSDAAFLDLHMSKCLDAYEK